MMVDPKPQQLIATYLGLLSDWFGDVADVVDASPHPADSAADAIMANPKLSEDFTERSSSTPNPRLPSDLQGWPKIARFHRPETTWPSVAEGWPSGLRRRS